MPTLSLDRAWRKVLVDRNAPEKHRLAALKKLVRPSISLLRELLADPATPSRLRYVLTVQYDFETKRSKELKCHSTQEL